MRLPIRCGMVCAMSDETRGSNLAQRLTDIGISKMEFAARASIDRSTLDRALADDEKVSERTWTKVERTLLALEDELGMAEAGTLVTTTIEIRGAKVTVKGRPSDVAETVRQMLP